MYSLLKGSIFDTKCDLLIVPCNSNGSVSLGILSGLYANNLPILNTPIEYGNVFFYEISNQYYNSFIIGYAATVGSFTEGNPYRKIKCIERIMLSILKYAKENSIRKINVPLLATGMGNVDSVDSFNTMKKIFEHENNIELCIYAYDNDKYEKLYLIEAENTKSTKSTIINNPRVFVSYTGADPENRTWVKEFVDKLRENGIDARIDMYHLKAGTDLPQWMTNEILLADKVILICDKYYSKKADFTTNANGGVGWETMIIQGDMMRQNKDCNKYIAIIREDNFDEGIPKYFRTKASFHWKRDTNINDHLKELLFCLFDCDLATSIGKIPEYIMEKMV